MAQTVHNGPGRPPKEARTGPRYPVYDLDSAIEVARKLHERGGDQASNHALATYLGYSGIRNGAFISRLAAARLYGLIEGPTSGLRLTPRAHDAVSPDYPEIEAQARLAAFESVPLFAAFFKEYEGKQLPPRQGMLNALEVKFGVPKSQSGSVLERLIDSAEQAGLFQIAGSRTKMVRPRVEGERPPTRAQQPAEPERQQSSPSKSRLPTLIEGALDELPRNDAWDEAQMKEWLDLFERVLRVVYKIPRRGPSSSQ